MLNVPLFIEGMLGMGDNIYQRAFVKQLLTDEGIRRWFAEQGFTCAEQNTIECQLGRKGVASYAFRRV